MENPIVIPKYFSDSFSSCNFISIPLIVYSLNFVREAQFSD